MVSLKSHKEYPSYSIKLYNVTCPKKILGFTSFNLMFVLLELTAVKITPQLNITQYYTGFQL